jgi:hypothetical protein
MLLKSTQLISLHHPLAYADFRHHCSEHYPTLLEGYYKIGDFWDSEKTADLRKLDLQAFQDQNSRKKADN